MDTWTQTCKNDNKCFASLSGSLVYFSSFAFIFGPFAFLCDCLYLYLVILWIILVFLASIFSHFASPCAFVAVLRLTMVGLCIFNDASCWGLLQVFTSQFFQFCITTFGLCLFLVTLHMFVLILCPLSFSFFIPVDFHCLLAMLMLSVILCGHFASTRVSSSKVCVSFSNILQMDLRAIQ